MSDIPTAENFGFIRETRTPLLPADNIVCKQFGHAWKVVRKNGSLEIQCSNCGTYQD